MLVVRKKDRPSGFVRAAWWLFWLCSCASCPELSSAAVPKISACDCKWPDLTVNTLQTCDSPPKLCSYCMDAVSYMYYGPENSATLGCLVEGRSLDVCTRVGNEIQAKKQQIMPEMFYWDHAMGDAGGASAMVCRKAQCCGTTSSFSRWGLRSN